jgi:hypothetical protein
MSAPSPIAVQHCVCQGRRSFSGEKLMGVHLYVCAGLIALAWSIWITTTYRNRESVRLAHEVNQRLMMSAELLSTIPGELRR